MGCINNKRHAILLITITMIFLISGCSLLKIHSQSQALQSTAYIQGKVKNTTTKNGPLNVMVFEYKNGFPLYVAAAYTSDLGYYHFQLKPGKYKIAAHVDINRDGKYQPSEPVTELSSANFLTVRPNANLTLPMLVISRKQKTALNLDTSVVDSLYYENIGKLISLNDPIFSQENYSMGMWLPIDFLDSIGGGLFVLSKYDEHKIPVLFVHGINGGPTIWKNVIKQLDKRKYQAWVYYYATGIQLDAISNSLLHAVTEMEKRYGFKKLIIAAYSMGGLVMRSFVKKYKEHHPNDYQIIKLVLTVNSPFGGIESASSGVKYSPIVLQSWRSLAKGSNFLKKLTSWSWPRNIPFHLVFSFVDGEAGDGVVNLADQLPYSIQNDATRLYGFSDTHVGTLSDPQFIKLFNSLLEESTQ